MLVRFHHFDGRHGSENRVTFICGPERRCRIRARYRQLIAGGVPAATAKQRIVKEYL